MNSEIKKICLTIMVQDFLRFSHYYEKNEEEFHLFCSINIDGLIKNSTIFPFFDESFYDGSIESVVIKTINSEMPLIISDICPLKSHFIDYKTTHYNYYAPQELFLDIVNIPGKEKNKCDVLIKKTIGSIMSLFESSINFETLFNALENFGTFFSVDSGNTSFFEFIKLKMGLASIIYNRLSNSNFESILVCSIDLLGIKDFKFKSSNNNLRIIQSASLYVDIFRENLLDELLDILGLTRANVIFCGGRHIHLFLPNTRDHIHYIEMFIKNVNNWCIDNHRTSLFVSFGYTAVKIDQLYQNNKPMDYYHNIFCQIANKKVEFESAKYTCSDIEKINKLNKSSGCNCFTKYINELFMMCSNGVKHITITSENGIPIFPGQYISLLPNNRSNIIRIYRNKVFTRSYDELEKGIWLNYDEQSFCINKTLDNEKLGVLRIDIDNFKKCMLSICKFQDMDLSNPINKMVLSKEFALFMRYYIYLLLKKYNNSIVIHEGADDAFFVSDIETILGFALNLSKAFKSYTNNILSISAGISVFMDSNSFFSTAQEAQVLMNKSKTIEGKDSVTVLTTANTFKWKDIKIQSINELSEKG